MVKVKTALASATVFAAALVLAMVFLPQFVGQAQVGIPLNLDHFKCYITRGEPLGPTIVGLEDQFGPSEAQVLFAVRFCNPAAKSHNGVSTNIQNPDHHLKFYLIRATTAVKPRTVIATNQFGENQKLKVFQPVVLAVPTWKIQPGEHREPQGLDHFKCYLANGKPVREAVNLQDQFHPEENVGVFKPILFCNPVDKLHNGVLTERQNLADHLTCYTITSRPFTGTVTTLNQFGQEDNLPVGPADILCAPSLKVFPDPLDHS